MHTKQYLALAAAALLLFTLTAVSCGKANELPPIEETNNKADKEYKQPDPTVLNAAEQKEVDSVKAEYEKGIK